MILNTAMNDKYYINSLVHIFIRNTYLMRHGTEGKLCPAEMGNHLIITNEVI